MAQQRRNDSNNRKVDYIAMNKVNMLITKILSFLAVSFQNVGKILPRRVAGTSAKNQRKVTTAIKRARVMALMPFVMKTNSN